MKKSLILGLLLLPLLLLSFVYPENKSGIKNQPGIIDTSFNLLAAYGEYVFGREGCIRCHVLVENTVPPKISLDGLQGKYPSEWHYNHLIDPDVMVPDSKMPSYRKLINREIGYVKLEALYKQKTGTETKPDSALIHSLIERSLLEISKTYFSLEQHNKNYDNKEITALICWLQNIKPSPAKQISDSIRNASAKLEHANKLNQWKIWMNNHKSEFYQVANSTKKEIIGKGHTLFLQSCTACHNLKAQGNIGPNLTDNYWLHGNSIEDLAQIIRFGHQAMPAWEMSLSPKEISYLIAYIRSLKGSNPPNAKEPQGKKLAD